jgi:colicin import membrane protein
MTDKVEFQGKIYTVESLSKMDEPTLLSLRNLVAENLGVAKIKGFQNIDQARDATWKALVKFNDTPDEGLASNETKGKAKAEKAPKEPKEPRHVKGAEPATVKRPTRGMFRKIQKIKEPDRVKERWENYKDGMTVLETIEGANMTPLDIYWYAEQGFVKLIEPTDEEFAAGVDAWYKRNGLENPNASKKKREEERAKAKAEKDAAKAAEAEAKAKAKADKEAAKAAEKEAAAKAKADKVAADKAAADAKKSA